MSKGGYSQREGGEGITLCQREGTHSGKGEGVTLCQREGPHSGKGGDHSVSVRILRLSCFCHIKDCLLKKGLQKGRYAPEIDLVVD